MDTDGPKLKIQLKKERAEEKYWVVTKFTVHRYHL